MLMGYTSQDDSEGDAVPATSMLIATGEVNIQPQIHVWDQDQDCSVFKEFYILDLAFDRCRRLGQLSYYSVSVIIQMMI